MAGQIPKPVVDSDSKPYWDGLNNHELMIQHCDDCSKHIFIRGSYVHTAFPIRSYGHRRADREKSTAIPLFIERLVRLLIRLPM